MPTETRAEDRESLSRSRDRIRDIQQQARAQSSSVVEQSKKITKIGIIKGLKNLDGFQMFFLGVAGFMDLIGFIFGMLSGSLVSLVDWIVDIPLLIFFIFLAAILVMSNPSSIKTMLIAFVGPVGVGIAEISPLGVLPFYLGWAVWLVSQINNSKQEKKEKQVQKRTK